MSGGTISANFVQPRKFWLLSYKKWTLYISRIFDIQLDYSVILLVQWGLTKVFLHIRYYITIKSSQKMLTFFECLMTVMLHQFILKNDVS